MQVELENSKEIFNFIKTHSLEEFEEILKKDKEYNLRMFGSGIHSEEFVERNFKKGGLGSLEDCIKFAIERNYIQIIDCKKIYIIDILKEFLYNKILEYGNKVDNPYFCVDDFIKCCKDGEVYKIDFEGLNKNYKSIPRIHQTAIAHAMKYFTEGKFHDCISSLVDVYAAAIEDSSVDSVEGKEKLFKEIENYILKSF